MGFWVVLLMVCIMWVLVGVSGGMGLTYRLLWFGGLGLTWIGCFGEMGVEV